jgi:hypothetical protein
MQLRGATATRIGAVVPAVLRQAQQQHQALAKIQRSWSRLVGKRLAAYTKPVSLRRGRLVVHADRPGGSFTLSYQRAQLLERLHAITPGRVKELVIRPGDLQKDV